MCKNGKDLGMRLGYSHDILDGVEDKVKGMQAYKTEMKKYNSKMHPAQLPHNSLPVE